MEELAREVNELRLRIAELEAVEAQLKQTNEELRLFKAIVESSREAIAVSDPEGRLVYVNPAHEELFGRSLQEAQDLNYRAYYPPESIAVLDEIVAPALRRGESWEGELEVLDARGRRFPLWERAVSIRDAEGRLLYGFGLMHNISARKEMEGRLADALEFSRKIIQVSTMGISVFNAAGRCILANETAAAIIGGRVEALLQLNFYHLESWKTSGLLETAIRALESGRVERREIHVTSTFGKELWMDCHFIAFTSGGEQHLLLLLDDISGRKEAEAALKRSYDELERRVEERTTELKKANQGLRVEIAERRQAEEALKQERDFSAALLDTLGALVVVLDRQGRIVRFNQACETTTGYVSREVLGKYVWDLFLAPEEVEAVKEVFLGLVCGDFPSLYENYWLTKDGGRRLISWSNTCLTDTEGLVAYIIGTGIEITEQRRAEEAWRRSQQQQKAILENIPDLAWLKDKESRFIAVNEAFGEACGVRPEDLVGKTDLDIWPRELAEGYRADDREVMQSRRRKQVEEPLQDHAGQAAWIETIKTPIVSETGEVMGTAGIARDITARKRTEEALKESEARFRSIFDRASVGMALVDRQGCVIMANEAD